MKNPTAVQKTKILELTKKINSMKITRSHFLRGSTTYTELSKVIEKKEKELKAKRTKWGI